MIRFKKCLLIFIIPAWIAAGLPLGVTKETSPDESMILHLRFSNPYEDTLWVEGKEKIRWNFDESNASQEDSTSITRVLQLPIALSGSNKPEIHVSLLKTISFSHSASQTSETFIQTSPIRYFRNVPLMDIIVNPFFMPGRYVLEAQLTVRGEKTGDKQQTRRLSEEEKAFFQQAVLNPEHVHILRETPPQALLKAVSFQEKGIWYQLGIQETGIYALNGSYLERNGISLSDLDKNRIHLFVSSTRGRPYISELPKEPFLVEIPILITGDADTPFQQQDKLIFYGESVSGWYSLTDGGPQYAAFQTNPYETVNHYWLFVAETADLNPKQMEIFLNSANPFAAKKEYTWGRMHHEKDEANLIQGGVNWYGESFDGPSSLRSIQLSLKNPTASYNVNAYMRIGVAGASKSGLSTDRHEFEFSLNNNPIWGIISVYDYNETSKVYEIAAEILQEKNTFSIKYTGSDKNTKAFLDFVDIIYPMELKATDDYLRIWYPLSNTPLEFLVEGFSGKLIYLFDISDPLNPRYQIKNDTSFSVFHNETSLESEYLILTESYFKEPLFMKKVEIDPLVPEVFEQTDMVIVTHKNFLSEAERLKIFKESHPERPLSVAIFTMEEIYNKYSGGNQDPHAIRNLLFDMNQRAPQPSPFYLVLFGDGDYDYRNISGKSKIFVPQYEISAGSIIHTRNTDDPFVYLSNDTDNTPDMAVGRIPVNSVDEARNYVNKLIAYETRLTQGDWQMLATLVADDPTNPWPNEPEFIKDSENKILPVLPKAMKINKIYLTEFPELYDPTIGSMGRVGAREAILESFSKGTILMNYIGHGSPFVWAQEYVFTKDRDLNQIQTHGMFPFIVAATCDWGRSDFIGVQSMAEEMTNLENNGAIGVIASTRGVLNIDNVDFTKKIYQSLFPDPKNSARSIPVGNAYLQGKVQAWSNLNVSKFQYFGDPALTLAVPQLNGEIYLQNQDTLKALSLVSVSGIIFDNDRVKITDDGITGWLELVDSDKLITREYRYSSGGTYQTGQLNYTLPGARLFIGPISVVEGDFTSQFIIPKDIRYEGNNGKIYFRYTSQDKQIEGLTYVDSLILAGSADTVSSDFEGPQIFLKTQDETFTTPSILVSDTIMLIISMKDPSGINITGSTGHAITMRINGMETNLTDNFVYEKDSWQEGHIPLPVKEWFQEGEHTVEISAFDNFNNFSSEFFYVQVIPSGKDILTDVMNFPNPFKKSTQFTFHNMQPGNVQIKIFTLSGSLLQTIDGGYVEKGFNYIPWDGRDKFGEWPAAGIYLYTLKLSYAAGESSTRGKLVILP